MAEQSSGDSKQRTETQFYFRNGGERLVRERNSEFAYLRAYGWVRAPRQRQLRKIMENKVKDEPGAVGWKKCSEGQARKYALRFFNEEPLGEDTLGLRERLKSYLATHDLRRTRRPVPFGPARRHLSRDIQRKAQELEVGRLGIQDVVDDKALGRWAAQAREGYEQEQRRIDGIQQRASFFLGATGLTTTAVLVNGGLLYGGHALHPSGMRIAVGVLLMIATAALAAAGYAALEATMVTFDRARSNSAWQIERRIGLDRQQEPRYLLAATLLATQRAEAIGDWKVRQLKWARLWFALAVLFLVLASLGLLLAALLR